ncbi:hypothetical protein EJO69_03365 [Flaviflexus salsibiostraticola]|uniref:Uncharacterized protein n=1 Tax=Flaviflexus salsibiostraticola TaxID=1282737 RepID=A0A3Q8WSQ7_9ACTO|nr:hypothetical protein [Flaviflexus salsibiostraticola]AZN29452.1 hypothetical protein EJO69_03365 [Flaviflexus salsibiostraticola]
MKIALVTHARHFAGPAAVEALTRDGYTVVCHDASFADAAERQRFESENPGTVALAEQKPERLVDATLQPRCLINLSNKWGTVHNRPGPFMMCDRRGFGGAGKADRPEGRAGSLIRRALAVDSMAVLKEPPCQSLWNQHASPE